MTAGGVRDAWYPPREARRPQPADWADQRRRLLYWGGRTRRCLDAEVTQVLAQWDGVRALDEASLGQALAQCRHIFRLVGAERRKAAAPVSRARALALIAEAAARCVGMRPYSVQLLAALAMHDGCLVQLAPGEGKTLSAALAAVLYGWSGRPCHVVTANDYLAERDAQQMRPLYARCGLSAAAVTQETPAPALAEDYAADLVYATGKQLLADYLRDQLLLGGITDGLRRRLWQQRQADDTRQPVMRGLWAAIVDEADSVLIDDAVTPLIISAPGHNPMLLEAVRAAHEVVSEMGSEEHYWIDDRFGAIRFTEAGEALLERATSQLPPLWHSPERRDDLISQAILARDRFQRDRHYVVQDEQVVIVDENTGRMMPGRSWSFGLHQAVEAQEGLELTHPSRTMARMSFQRFFRGYHRLCGASGTLHGIERELWDTYGRLTMRIPARLPSRLSVAPPRHFQTRQAKQAALIEEAQALHEQGLPVLVGSRRIGDSEAIAEALEARGVECSVLNAKQHAREAEVIARAGEAGWVTVATNMAGRGTDVRLGAGVAERGGLQVLMLEPHESPRVDWQLFGRAGRQGALGRAQPFVSLDDELLRRYLPVYARPLRWLARYLPFGRKPCVRCLLPLAQRRAQRRAWRQRRQLVRREESINRQLTFTGQQDLAAGPQGSGS